MSFFIGIILALVFESVVAVQICASATKKAFSAAESELSIKDLPCSLVLIPMEWGRRVTRTRSIKGGIPLSVGGMQ